MSTTVTPEQNSADQAGTSSGDSSQPATQQTNQPPAGPTDSAAQIAMYERALRDQSRKIDELMRKVDETSRREEPPARSVEEERTQWFENPQEATRAVVRQEMERTVAPLLEIAKELRGTTTGGNIKAKFKVDPRYAKYLSNPTIDAYLDQAIASLPNVNEDSVRAAIVHIIGMANVGDVPGYNPAPAIPQAQQTSTQQPVPPTPPYIPPSPGPAPRRESSDAVKRRPLTEGEDFLRRQRGMTVEKWWELMEAPADKVVDMKVERK